MRFQFCLVAGSIGQDSAILPDDQPITLRESRISSHVIIIYSICIGKLKTYLDFVGKSFKGVEDPTYF